MSLIAKILNTYTNEQGDPEIHFVDDLGKEYTLAYGLEHIIKYFDGHPRAEFEEVDRINLEDYFKYGLGGEINPHFKRYIGADIMNWRAVVELEDAN